MNVFVADEQDDPLDTEPLRHLAEEALRAEGFPDTAEVTLLFVTGEQMARYNQRFLNRSGPTDVLAFPLEDLQPGRVPPSEVNGPPLNVGDVVIAPDFVRRQARDMGVPFNDELALMVVHGVLHLLGYDHQDDEDAAAMERRERELLAVAGRRRR